MAISRIKDKQVRDEAIYQRDVTNSCSSGVTGRWLASDRLAAITKAWLYKELAQEISDDDYLEFVDVFLTACLKSAS